MIQPQHHGQLWLQIVQLVQLAGLRRVIAGSCVETNSLPYDVQCVTITVPKAHSSEPAVRMRTQRDPISIPQVCVEFPGKVGAFTLDPGHLSEGWDKQQFIRDAAAQIRQWHADVLAAIDAAELQSVQLALTEAIAGYKAPSGPM